MERQPTPQEVQAGVAFLVGEDPSHDGDNSNQPYDQEHVAEYPSTDLHLTAPLCSTQRIEQEDQGQNRRYAVEGVTRDHLEAECLGFAAEHVRHQVENSSSRDQPCDYGSSPPKHLSSPPVHRESGTSASPYGDSASLAALRRGCIHNK